MNLPSEILIMVNEKLYFYILSYNEPINLNKFNGLVFIVSCLFKLKFGPEFGNNLKYGCIKKIDFNF